MENRRFNLSNEIVREMVKMFVKNTFWINVVSADLKETDQEKLEKTISRKLEIKLSAISKRGEDVFSFQDRLNEVRDKILEKFSLLELKKYVSEMEALNIIEKFKEFTFFIKYEAYDLYVKVKKENKLSVDSLLKEINNLEI